jgi:hypothetical protein
LGREVPPLRDVGAEAVRERISIFEAYSLPTVMPLEVPNNISPVNIARLVLRHYFGANLPALPDITYWSATTSAYDFEAVHLQ